MSEILKKITIEELFLILVIAGFVVFSAIAIPIGVENGMFFTFPYRLLVLILATFIIYKNLDSRKLRSLPIILLVVFWIYYFFKGAYSFNNDYYHAIFSKNINEFYLRVPLIALVPSIALIIIDYTRINLQKVLKICYWVFATMLMLNLVFVIFHLYVNDKLRVIFSTYYITSGQFACTLSIMSIFYLLFDQTMKSNEKLLHYFTFFLGIFSIVLFSARSPILSFFFVMLYFLFFKKNFRLIAAFFLAVLSFVIFIYFYHYYGDGKIIFFERTYNWLFLGDTSLRTPLYRKGINIFLENPIFGGRVLFEDGMYPHNIFLELLMATGIFGLLLYFSKFYHLVRNYKIFVSQNQVLNNHFILIFALFLQYLILVNTSYNIFRNTEFLYFSAIVLGISLNYSYEKVDSAHSGRYKT